MATPPQFPSKTLRRDARSVVISFVSVYDKEDFHKKSTVELFRLQMYFFSWKQNVLTYNNIVQFSTLWFFIFPKKSTFALWKCSKSHLIESSETDRSVARIREYRPTIELVLFWRWVEAVSVGRSDNIVAGLFPNRRLCVKPSCARSDDGQHQPSNLPS